MSEQQLFLMQVVVRATEDEAEQIVTRLGSAICGEDDHVEECINPWTLVMTKVADLEEPERTEWRELAEDDWPEDEESAEPAQL